MPDVSRASLTAALTVLLAVSPVRLAALGGGSSDPHLDPAEVPGSCQACHEGHGEPRSPMLASGQVDLCLRCHGSRGQVSDAIGRGDLASGASPRSLDLVLTQPFTHPLDTFAYSREEAPSVTCTSCHSPHRGRRELGPGQDSSGAGMKMSTRSPERFEYELCQDCHGNLGATTIDPRDISRLTDPSSRSFHPIQVPAGEGSPSTFEERTGREINCTDCHGNSDPRGARGPHGSAFRYILRREYVTTDGRVDDETSYQLCYSCHDREVLMAPESSFPLHESHVLKIQASCATCHNPHGSVFNRALIRFGEEVSVQGVSPSISTGRLELSSGVSGSGSCYLTCHGVDHAPKSYGLGQGMPAALLAPLGVSPAGKSIADPLRPEVPSRPGRASKKDRKRID